MLLSPGHRPACFPDSPRTELHLHCCTVEARFFKQWPGGKQGNSFPHVFSAAARVGWRTEAGSLLQAARRQFESLRLAFSR